MISHPEKTIIKKPILFKLNLELIVTKGGYSYLLINKTK